MKGSSMPIWGILGDVIVLQETKFRAKVAIFVLKIYSFAYNPKTAGYEKLKFVYNVVVSYNVVVFKFQLFISTFRVRGRRVT